MDIGIGVRHEVFKIWDKEHGIMDCRGSRSPLRASEKGISMVRAVLRGNSFW